MENIDIELNQLIWDAIFPIGSIRKFTNDIDPNKLYGGTWIKMEGVFLLASDKNHPIGSTGGEATHKLTVAELPKFKPLFHGSAPFTIQSNGGNRWAVLYDDNVNGAYIDEIGGDQEHNNMPPYRVVNVWERIA